MNGFNDWTTLKVVQVAFENKALEDYLLSSISVAAICNEKVWIFLFRCHQNNNFDFSQIWSKDLRLDCSREFLRTCVVRGPAGVLWVLTRFTNSISCLLSSDFCDRRLEKNLGPCQFPHFFRRHYADQGSRAPKKPPRIGKSFNRKTWKSRLLNP